MLYYVENDVLIVKVNKDEKTKFSMDKIISEMSEEIIFFTSGMGRNTPLFKKKNESGCDKIEYRFNWCSDESIILEKEIEEIEERLYYKLRSFANHYFDNKSSGKFSWVMRSKMPDTVSLIIDFK